MPVAGLAPRQAAGRGYRMQGALSPTDLPGSQWVRFPAEGFPQSVPGVIYRLSPPATNGMPLGAIDTGCLDIDTSGMLG